MANAYERLQERKKNKSTTQPTASNSSGTTAYERLQKRKKKKELEGTIKFDTFDSDLKALGTTVESVYSGWQPKDTISNTKTSIAAMQERLNAYNEYAKLFGGEDVSDLSSGYQSVLEDLDKRAATYNKFKTAEDYNKAAEREKSLPTADLNAVSTEVADLDKQIAEIKAQKEKFDNEYKANGGYIPSGSNYNRPSVNQVNPYKEWQAKSSEYEQQIKDLENKKADRQAFYEDAKTTQETLATIQKETAMASDPKNMDAFNQYIANYDAKQAEKEDTPWWVTALGNIGGSNSSGMDTINQVVRDKRSDTSWQLPQGDWTDDEKRVLGGYFLTDPQAAIDYVVRKNNEKAKGEQANTETNIQDSATSNFWAGAGHTAGAIATAPFGLADYLDDVTDKLAGRPIIEESMVTPFEYSQAVTGGISTHLNDVSGTLNENIPVIGGKGLGDAYGLGTSVLQSAASAYTLGGVGTLISYFGQGAAAGVDDALARGATDEQALTYGLVLGAAEGVSEMIGADKLLKLGSPNEIRKILVNGFKKGGGKAFWSLVDKQGKAEAIEEAFSGLAGQVADNFILKGKSNFEALTREYRAMGMSAVEAQKKAWMQSIGDVAYDTLGGYLSGAVHAGPQIAVSAHKQKAKNKTIGKEIRDNERVTDMLNIASLSPQESDAYAAYTEYAKQGVNAENITDAQLGNLYGMAEADAVSSLHSKKATTEQKLDAGATYNRLAEVKAENKAEKETKELSQTEEGKVTPTTREEYINGLAEEMKKESEAKAELFRLVDDGKANAENYADSFNYVVAMAQNDYSQDFILEHRGVLSTGQVNSIYQAVVTNPKMAQQKRLETLIQEQGDNLEIKGTIDDSVIDYNNTGAKGKVNWNDLHPNVRATVAYISGFATKVAGMDVKLVTNGRDYGFKGKYDRQVNTLYIDITALTEKIKGADTKGRKDNSHVIISVVAHEVTHWMEEKAPELYAQYSKMVMDALSSGKYSEMEIVLARKELMQKAENARAEKEGRKPHKYTDKDARREVIARASEDMLALSEEGKKIFESLTESEQKTFVDKIKEVIQDIKNWIENVLSKLTSDTEEAKMLRELAQDLDAISKKWDEMLRQAAKANAAMKKAGVNDKAIMESKASDTQNADIDKYGLKQDNISRANKQGEFINEFYEALSKKEWHDFYTGLKKDGYLADARVGVVAPIVVGDKLVIAERQYMKEDVHDYVVQDVFRIENYTGSNYDLHLIKEAIEEGVIIYDTRTIYKKLHKLLKGTFSTEILARFDGNSLRFVVGVTEGENRADNGTIRRNSQEGVAGTGLSLGNQSGVQRDNGLLNKDSQYSDVDEDSEGNELTAEQQEFFKNSTVRDESGKLKVMYHGTPNAGFTKFRSGTYFTEHKWYAERYKESGASSLSYKQTANNPDVYAVYLNIQKPFDTRNPKEREIFNSEYFGHYGMGTPLMESGLPDWLDGMDLQEFLEEQGYDYDGLILDEGSVGGYGDEVVSRGLSYVVFSPEQVKNVDNLTPTADPDIRYSDIDAEYMDAVENGDMEKAQRMVYDAAKNAGYTDDSSWKMQHTAPNSKDDVSLDKLKESGLVPDDYWSHPEWYTYSPEERESFYKVKKAIERQERYDAEGKPFNAKMYVYRAVDKTVNSKEDYFRNGDWVTPSYDYAVNEGKMNPKGYRIIKHSVSIKNLYWDGNSIAELGYDDGETYAYADTLNNRKLLDPVTYDDAGNVIPLSKRFKKRNWDVRYSDIDELDDLHAQLKEKQNQIYSASMELRKFDAKAEEEKLYAVLQKDGASKEELDEALQVYAKWGEESGYADASKKLSALKDEEKLLRREIQKVEDRLHDELKEQIAHWDEEDVKKYVAKAVRKYHTTTRLDKASYLVTTGSMLDFSDGQSYRVKDHREISEILDLPDYAEYSDGMIAFMNMGNIRLQTYGIDISAMPNAKQFSALRDIIFTVMRENDEFSVDFSKTDGYSAGSVTYGKGTSASKIIADIKSYFETGVVPEEQSNIRDFLYSDIDAEVDIYEVLGENKRLQKENKKLHEDFDRVMELLELERQLTHGNHFNENQLGTVAGHIRNIANSSYSKPELVKKLKEVYTYLATSKEVTWDDLFARLYGIAEDVLGAARPILSPNDYYANIYKDIRNTEISLSDEQKKYVKDMLGVNYHKAFFGKIKVSDNGISLNSKWEEWAGKYPNEFTETQPLDQVLELLDIYETAKELKEVVEEYNVVERTRWLANEIYNQYWNVSTIRTTADKYDTQIKRLKHEHRNAMKELRDSYNERLEKQKQLDRAERSRIFKKLREDHIKELKEIKRSSKERLDKYKEDAARKTRIQSITAQALTLNEWLVKNSKDKHIHESMKGPVIALLNAIDFSSKRALGMWGGDMKGVPTNQDISLQKALSQVQKMMADASVGKEELVLLYGHELDADIADMIESVDNITRTVGDNEFILNKMTLDDLITVDNVVRTIKSAVTQMNKFHIVNHTKGIANLAQEEIIYAEKLGKAKIYKDKTLKAGVKKLLAWKNINPYYAFKRFGTAGKKIFEAFQDGYDKFAFNIKEIIDFTNSTYKSEEVQAWEKEIKSFELRMPATDSEMSSPDYEPQKQKVQMTVAQIMDLYLLNKREAARVHLLGGGIRVADIEAKGNEIISQSEGALLEQSEIDKIIQSLTPRQIEVADKLSHFMNTTTTAWGNEVSMARFGYKAFGEKNYVPMQVDKNNLAVDDETEKNNSLFRLLNMSFTKSLTENANNRLVISSIFDVFAQHTSDMAKYNALALPVLDAFRWYNYKEKGFKGETAFVTKSVKQAVENAFGKDGQSYITTFLKDLNGQENTSRDTLGKGFLTRAKIAAVGANIRVALLQPTAYFRASANIGSKYLVKALGHKPKIDLAEKYCGMALWKSLGYFDTNVQRGVADQIKHAETPYDKAVELSMKGAEKMDKLTFGYLWNAAELEIREKRQDLKVGSDEFYLEVGKRLRDIIYSTQVVDSVMTRSEMMRSPDAFDKLLTAFASESTLSYSMLADAVLQYQLDVREVGKKAAREKNNKHIARVFVAYTTTNLAAALVESLFDALRDDDDEEMDAGALAGLYFENFATNQSILAKIPWLKEAVSIMQGFSSSRMDTQGLQTFANALKQTFKLTQGESSWGKTIKSYVQSFSYLSGLPFYNAWRDLWASIDKLFVTDEELEEILKDFY